MNGPSSENEVPVTVATFRFVPKAEAAVWALEQEGVRAFLADANLVNADWFLGNAVGFVKLQVPSSQVEAARRVFRESPRLLDRGPEDQAAPEGPAKCLACEAPMAEEADRCGECGWTYKAPALE